MDQLQCNIYSMLSSAQAQTLSTQQYSTQPHMQQPVVHCELDVVDHAAGVVWAQLNPSGVHQAASSSAQSLLAQAACSQTQPGH
jgi:hypothetical protein